MDEVPSLPRLSHVKPPDAAQQTDQLGAAANLELLERLVQTLFDGGHTPKNLLGDLLVPQPLRRQEHSLPFRRGELRE